MPKKIPWDEATAGQALAVAMAERYGLSQEEVLTWYHKAVTNPWLKKPETCKPSLECGGLQAL